MADGLSLPESEPLDPAAVAEAVNPDRPPAFDPSKPFKVLGGAAPPPFDPSKPFEVMGEKPSVMDRVGDFVKGSAGDVLEDVKTAGKRAYEGAQSSTADFTTPIDTESWTPHPSGLAGELLEPFAPSIGVAGATAARAVKSGMDLISPAVGAVSGLIENPVGKPGAAAVRAAADKIAPNSAAAEMTPEEFSGDVANVGLMAFGGEHGAAPKLPPVAERLATPTLDRVEGVPPPAPVTEADLVDPAAARAAPQPPAEVPPAAAAPVPAPEAAPQPAAASAAPHYTPQFDLETNSYHVAGPDGQRLQYEGGDLRYNRPEDAAVHADILNNGRPAEAPPAAPVETPAPVEVKPPAERLAAPPDSTRPAEEQIVNVNPQDLNLDPQRFQYKASDDKGVTGDLSAVKQWEPSLTNPITAWRDNDGNMFVVNGHQRTDLARRAQDAGQPDIQMPARIYNESDGYTPEYMRALGAVQNMAEGSGTAIDAAKVLRALPDLPEGKPLPMTGLNVARGLAKDAQGLASLTDHGFGLVTNEVIPPEYAAEVGRRITDPTEQNAALDTLVKSKPASVAQARFMVDDMINNGFLHGEQTSLFGTEQLAQSLLGERSQILDNSIRQLKRNKSLFNAAVTGEDTLSGAGNVLDRDANLKGKTENEQLVDHLAGATKKGPLSDALSQSARDLAAGKPVARATSEFLAKARQVVKSGYAPESVSAGADLGRVGPAREAEAEPVGGEPYRQTEADGQSGMFEEHPNFYSTLEREVDRLPQGKAPPDQWKSIIKNLAQKGVKQEEVDWSGVNEWLDDQKGSVTKADMLDHIRANTVRLDEFTKATDPLESINTKMDALHTAMVNETAVRRGIPVDPQAREYQQLAPDAEAIAPRQAEWDALVDQKTAIINAGGHNISPKYADYQIPGGTNYRELLMTKAPTTKAWEVFHPTDGKPIESFDTEAEAQKYVDDRPHDGLDVAQRDDKGNPHQYRSPHWIEPNVLAHVRMNDRTDAQGRKVLHVEEIQSDWHQQGRKKGYDTGDVLQRASDQRKAVENARVARLAAAHEVRSALQKISAASDANPWVVVDDRGKEFFRRPTEVEANIHARNLRLQGIKANTEYRDGTVDPKLREALAAAEKKFKGLLDTENAQMAKLVEIDKEADRARYAVPDAPFKNTWHELAMKRALRYAAENGYDRLTWTKGDTQAERYDLSKHLSRIELQDNSSGGISRADMEGPFEHGMVRAFDPYGEMVVNRHINSENELVDTVGKEAAEKLLSAPAREARSAGFQVRHRELTGLDLKIGGEGMKGFYDRILPNFVNKYVKKWGAKVDESHLFTKPPQSLKEFIADQRRDWGVMNTDDELTDMYHQYEVNNGVKVPVHGVDITPEMRDSVMRGQALFEPKTEMTDQGEQFIMPGAERTATQAAAARGDAKITSSKTQKPADLGMFAPKVNIQPDMFDQATKLPLDKPLANPNRAAADYVSAEGRKDKNEHLAVVDARTGEITQTATSSLPDFVAFSPELMARMYDPNERLVIHHNHPRGTALSVPDIAALMGRGVEAIIAHTHDGDMSIARLTATTREFVASRADPRVAWLKVQNVLKATRNSIFDTLGRAVRDQTISPDEGEHILQDTMFRAAHENGLLDYTTTHDMSHLPHDLIDDVANKAAWTARRAMKENGFVTDVRGSPEPVRPEEGLAGLPGSDGKVSEAAPARVAGGDQGNAPRAPVANKQGQYALLESGLHEAPEVKEVFDRATKAISAGRGPLKTPIRLANALGDAISDSIVGRVTRRVVSPGTFDDTARIAARGIRQVFGQMYLKDLQAEHALRSASDALDKMDTDGKNEFAMAYDEGRPQATPELTKMAADLRKVTDEATKRLQSLGVLEDAKEVYLGRIWKPRGEEADVKNSDKVLARLASKTPITGGKSFLKQRYYDSYRSALDSGLEPRFSNPIMTQLVKISEMNRYFAGTVVQRGAKQSGMAKFFTMGEDHGDMMELKGSEFQRPTRIINHADGTTTAVPEGAWYAPEGFARVLNNFQSTGLRDTPFNEPAKFIRAATNAMNSLQLGFSFFHPMFTSVDAQISRIGIGIDQAMRGEFGKGAGNIAGGISPTNWYTNMKAGDEFLKSVLDPEHATPEQQRLVDAFGAGGGRVFMQRVLAPTDEGFIKVWKSGAFGRAIQDANAKYPGSPIKATMNVLGRVLETTTAPIMDYIVPRQKLGVFSRMAQDWIDSHPQASNTEFVAAMQDKWESVDNRLGQMVYDNLFWDKTLKDIAFMTTRSVGWNLGSLREIGRGLADTGKFAADVAAMKSPEWTSRMSYIAALTTMSMTMGATIQYLFTGQGPQELKDYFYPRTGFTAKNGAPDRMQMPTYMKDVFAYIHNPTETLANKQSPMLSFLHEAITGKDYFGDLIANKDDPVMKQVEDVMKFAAGAFEPFSIQGTSRMFKERPGPAAVMGMFGFTPAPGYITNPKIEEKFERRQHKEEVTKTRKKQARDAIVTPLKPMPPARAAGGRVLERDHHDQAAAMADPDPTDPQILAGNYRKGHTRIHGLDVSIETAKGQVRRGVGKDGKPWKIRMQNHYGYVRGTVGADDEQVDCFIGFFPRADHVYVIDQVDPDTHAFDEHKCMIAFPNLPTAVAAYRRAFSDGKGVRRIGNIRAMTIAEFKEWLSHGDTKNSIAA